MASLSWNSSVYGFDFRNMILTNVYLGPTSGEKDPTQVVIVDKGPGGYGPATDRYSGSFTYGATSSDVSGTVRSLVRQEDGPTGAINGISLSYQAFAAAAQTSTKDDDLSLWSLAFSGDDQMFGGSSNDYIQGFTGNDDIDSVGGNDTLDGGQGNDYLSAGFGNDTLFGAEDNDSLLGEAGKDFLDGGSGSDSLYGGDGNDSLYGIEGRDLLIGGRGADRLYGGAGTDSFTFVSVNNSTNAKSGRDTIFDFSSRQKDKIDLKSIDASTKVNGNQAFKFIYSQDFHHKAGELRWEKVKSGAYVYGDVNGDGKADLSIFLKDVTKLTKGDFYL